MGEVVKHRTQKWRGCKKLCELRNVRWLGKCIGMVTKLITLVININKSARL